MKNMIKTKDRIARLEAILKKEEADAREIKSLLSKAIRKVDITFTRITHEKNDRMPSLYGVSVWLGSKTSYAKVNLEYFPKRQSVIIKVGRSKVASRLRDNEAGCIDERQGTGGYSKRIPLDDLSGLLYLLRKYHVKPSEIITKLKSYGGKSK